MTRMLKEDEAAEVLGCSVALLRKWRLVEAGPAYCKLGRLVRYADADIQAFIDAQRVQTGGGR